MASKQLRKAIEKIKGKETLTARVCEVCGKETANCAHKEDASGKTMYCLCPGCLVYSEAPVARKARAGLETKRR